MTTKLEVRLNARLPAVQRGDRYEDPLAYWIEGRFPGSRVTGGGTLRSKDGEPLVCGIDAEVEGDLDEIEDAVVELLESLGAPRGSTVALEGRSPRELGDVEGVALYLDSRGLPAEVYAENDVNEFLDDLHDALDGFGAIQSFWEGHDWTAVYVYGPSAQAIADVVAPYAEAHALGAGARVERIA